MTSDFEAELYQEAVRAAAVEMGRKQAQRAKTAEVDTRPERSEDLLRLEQQVSTTVRRNINAIMDIEGQYEDGLTRNQLGIQMGWLSKIIYDRLNEKSSTNLGMSTICRFSLALKIPVHVLVLPHDQFKKLFLAGYKKERSVPRMGKRG